ncbi:Lytic transglycosylase [Rhizobium sp. Pop5]|nr:Lytic transglycosylase [Rhizobium sp. Pop5]
MSGLKRGLVVSTMLCCGVVTGCSSVEYTSQAELTAAQTVIPMPKPGEDATLAAIPTAEGASGQAVAGAVLPQTQTTPPLTATAMPAATASQPADLGIQPVAYAQIPLTPEMTAIQSVVPTPRPGAPAQPTTQLAFAATPQNSALAALAAVDTTPRSMDYGFDESGPIDPPTAPPMFSDDDTDDAPTVEKSFVTKLIPEIFEDLRNSRNAAPPHRPSREPLQSEGLQQAWLFRPDADQIQHRQINGLRRCAGRPLRRRDQHQIRREISPRRLARLRQQGRRRRPPLCARLLLRRQAQGHDRRRPRQLLTTKAEVASKRLLMAALPSVAAIRPAAAALPPAARPPGSP